MTNFNIDIKDLEFNKNTPQELENCGFYKEWPVVYLLNNDKEMYVGETYHSSERMKQHLKNPKRQSLNKAHIIGSKDFTKSATLDIESSLIELCSSIPNSRLSLQNENNGLVKHNYANKEEFKQDSKFFARLWKELADRGLVSGDIETLKNSDLFKYSPYKSLNAEQCTVRDYILEDIKNSLSTNKNQTIFVNGSAGTGKSILAIYLMKLLVTNANYFTEDEESETLPFIDDIKKIHELSPNIKIGYVVAMTSFKNTLKEVFKHIKGLSASMVIGPSDVAKQKYDILIVDEAHRLMKRKNLTGYGEFDKTNKKLGLANNKSENDGTQLDWVLKQSKIQILFYDSSQSIKPTDVNAADFELLANNKESIEYNLSSQMRCLGGLEYIKYIKNVLNGLGTNKEDFDNLYELKLFDNINDFCNAILEKENKYGLSRIVSGYGFKWISKKGTKNKINQNENTEDIVIENKKFFWNKNSSKWPTSIKGNQIIHEVGCVHTIQGYDLNYCGVIFGPEIIYRNGNVEIDKDKYFDIKGKAGVKDYQTLKKYIINIYTVLMTRGIKGTYVYVCDKQLREYLGKYINF